MACRHSSKRYTSKDGTALLRCMGRRFVLHSYWLTSLHTHVVEVPAGWFFLNGRLEIACSSFPAYARLLVSFIFNMSETSGADMSSRIDRAGVSWDQRVTGDPTFFDVGALSLPLRSVVVMARLSEQGSEICCTASISA